MKKQYKLDSIFKNIVESGDLCDIVTLEPSKTELIEMVRTYHVPKTVAKVIAKLMKCNSDAELQSYIYNAYLDYSQQGVIK